MKNYMNRLFTALLLLCSIVNLTAQNHIVNSAANKPTPKTVNNPDEIFIDTLGKYVNYKPQNIKNKGGAMASSAIDIKKDIIDVVVDAAIEGWDAIFEKDRPKVVNDAFNIGVEVAYGDNKSESDINLSLANRKIPPPSVSEPAPVFEKKEMTVKFENGQFVPIAAKKDSISQIGKGIVESTFKMDVVDLDEIDLEFFNNKTFVHNGEVYQRVSKEEMETTEYKKPRIKTPKPAPTPTKTIIIPNMTKPQSIASKSITIPVTPIKHVKITSNEQFVDLYDDVALDGERYGVPYAITMAQGILESRGGRSRMAIALNNLFGIKCNGGRCKKSGCSHGYFDDDRESETFEGYNSFEASFKRHIKFFLDNDRYDKCLSCGTRDLDCWLYRLQRSGYATDKMYDYKLAEIINRYKLTTKPIHYDRKKAAERLKINPETRQRQKESLVDISK
jgi:flagellum-specific peptidoglycan hydrolase FlgJ